MTCPPTHVRFIALTLLIFGFISLEGLPIKIKTPFRQCLPRPVGAIASSFPLTQEQANLSDKETEEAKQQALKDAEAKGYTRGQKEGYEKGQREGYEKGSKEGEARGYDAGYGAGIQAKEAKEKADSWVTKVREALAWIFGYLFYPVVVIGIFLYIVAMIAVIIKNGVGAGRVRRAVGAVLPILILVFLVVTGQDKDNPIGTLFGGMSPLWRFIAGGTTGLVLMEAGKLLLDIDNEISSSLYALFLSSLGAFLIWSIMGGVLPIINLSLLGLVLAGCLHVIFRGPPDR